jgi:hypothetical protein
MVAEGQNRVTSSKLTSNVTHTLKTKHELVGCTASYGALASQRVDRFISLITLMTLIYGITPIIMKKANETLTPTHAHTLKGVLMLVPPRI